MSAAREPVEKEPIEKGPVHKGPVENGATEKGTESGTMGHGWTFLTNHSHVLICLAREPDLRVRDMAERVGITERAVMRIVTELEEAGIVTRLRDGRRNHYKVHIGQPLRHPVEAHCTIGDLLMIVQKAGAKN